MRRVLIGLSLSWLMASSCFADIYHCIADSVKTITTTVIYPSGRREKTQSSYGYAEERVRVYFDYNDLSMYNAVSIHYPDFYIYGQGKKGRVNNLNKFAVMELFPGPGAMSAPAHRFILTNKGMIMHLRSKSSEKTYTYEGKIVTNRVVDFKSRGECTLQ